MKRTLLLALASLALSAETVSNGIKISTMETTEGLTVRVVASSCNTEAIRVQVRTATATGWEPQFQIKPVMRCDQKPLEFRFALPGAVIKVEAYELIVANTGSGQ